MTQPARKDRLGGAVSCVCERGPVIAAAFHRDTSLLVRRIGDMGHHSAADWRCADCIADMAEEVGAHPRRPSHPDFNGADSVPSPTVKDRLKLAAAEWDARPEWTKPVVSSPHFPRRAGQPTPPTAEADTSAGGL